MGRGTLKPVRTSLALAAVLSASLIALPVYAKKAPKEPSGAAETAPAAASPAQDVDSVLSADTAPVAIKQFEQRLFFKTYSDNQLPERVERIEKRIFGEAVAGDVTARIAKLEQVLQEQLAEEKKRAEGEEFRAERAKPQGGAAGGSPADMVNQKERARIQAQAAREEEIAGMLSDGVNLYRQKQGKQAQEKFEQVLRLDPQNAQAHFNLGIVEESTGNFVGAFNSYKQAAQQEPDNKDYADAVQAISKKANKQQQVVGQQAEMRALADEANAAWKRGEFMSALDKYQQLDAKEPNRALVKYNIGSIYLMLKDQVNALDYYKKAKELEPNHAKYVKAYEQLAQQVNAAYADQSKIQQDAMNDFNSAHGMPVTKPGKKGKGKNQQAAMPAAPQGYYAPAQQMLGGYPQGGMRPNGYPQQQGGYPQARMQGGYPQGFPQGGNMQGGYAPNGGMQGGYPQGYPQNQNMQNGYAQSNAAPPSNMVQQNNVAPQNNAPPPNSPFAQFVPEGNAPQKKKQRRASFGANPRALNQLGGMQPQRPNTPIGMPQPQARPDVMSSYGFLCKSNGEGVTVTTIGIASRAAGAGLVRGDDIRAVDGIQVASPDEVNQILSQKNPAERISVLVMRNGTLVVLTL